ncbi:hypothetical protein GCM10009727_94390 [Actinomadura napierensis]|uniref:Uncharacterized protein n=1 Tax=Actinomadura napierensis TaxID=267854 RepID=A0ABN3AJL4_9ACTN
MYGGGERARAALPAVRARWGRTAPPRDGFTEPSREHGDARRAIVFSWAATFIAATIIPAVRRPWRGGGSGGF